MSLTEIKETKSELIEWIEHLSDENMLNILNGLKNSELGSGRWEDLSDAQKRHINEGIDDEENGRVISSEEFWRNLKNEDC